MIVCPRALGVDGITHYRRCFRLPAVGGRRNAENRMVVGWKAVNVAQACLEGPQLDWPSGCLGVRGRHRRSAWEAQAEPDGPALVELKRLPPQLLQPVNSLSSLVLSAEKRDWLGRRPSCQYKPLGDQARC
ncbi:uncharacterized protein LOC144165267 isoform X2 [Haemaphysalis longicornis]